MRILVVEDEPKVARFLVKGLTEEGYAVDLAEDGEGALNLIAATPFDAMILDVMIPDPDGFEVCRRVRSKNNATPILLLTARQAVEDRVTGLDAGADDYLTKPFAFSELLARIRALLRRRSPGDSILRAGDLEMDPVSRRVSRPNGPIDLTAKEYALLEFFLRRPDHILSRTQITDHVWNYDFDPTTNLVDVYVNHLRRKIGSGGAAPKIKTVRGMGYMLSTERP